MGTEKVYVNDALQKKRKTALNSSDHLEVRDETDTSIMDIEAHGTRHDIGGADEIPGLASHGTRHDIGGADEIPGLASHGTRHDIGGADEIPGLASHGSRHAYGGADAIADDGLNFAQIDKSLATTETTVAVGAGARVIISKGVYYASLDADVRVEYSTDGGTTWKPLCSPGTACLVISDGAYVSFHNSGTASENGYLVSIS